MLESKSSALPLGDSPTNIIFFTTSQVYQKKIILSTLFLFLSKKFFMGNFKKKNRENIELQSQYSLFLKLTFTN